MEARPLHVALVVCNPTDVGGMQTFSRFLVSSLLEADWRVTVALSGQDLYSGAAGNGRLSVERVEWLDGEMAGDREYRPGRIGERYRWFRRVRPDVAVFVQSSNTPYRASIVGAWLAGVPVVSTHRTMPYRIPHVPSRRHLFGLLPGLGLYRRKHIFRTWLTARLSRRIVFNSAAVKQCYERDYHYPAGKGRVVVNALGSAAASELAAVSTVGSSVQERRPFTVGFVGRLAVEKRLDVLLRAAARLSATGEMRVVFYGEGPERPALERLSAELGMGERVRFAGVTADAARAYAGMDVVVLPSRRESSSNMVLEAMAAGRAVVVTDVGGQPELVDGGRCGVIVRAEDVDALAEALERLRSDPAERAALGARARERALTLHRPERVARAWMAVLRDAAGVPRGVGEPVEELEQGGGARAIGKVAMGVEQ